MKEKNKTQEKNYVSAVLYIYNQEKKIVEFLKKIDSFFFDNFENYEIIIVNDGSTDNTVKQINENKPFYKGKIIILHLSWQHKIELAMLAGTEIAVGDFIFEFDDTIIDYPIELIMDLFRKSTTGYDVVSAVPENKRKLSSTLFYRVLNKVSYLNLDLTTEKLRIISRRALNRVLDLKEKSRYRKALYRYSGFPSSNIYYRSDLAYDGADETSLKDKFALSIDVLFSFSNIGLQISLSLSLIFLSISVLLGLYTIFIYIYLDTVRAGWTTTMLFLSFGFSGIFLVLGILGKYLTMILTEIQNRPNYIVKTIDRLN